MAIALAPRLNILSDADAACVAIALDLCLNRRCIKQRYKRRPQFTHENLMTDLMFSKPNYYKIIFFLCDSTVRHLMGHSRPLPLQSLKNY